MNHTPCLILLLTAILSHAHAAEDIVIAAYLVRDSGPAVHATGRA